MNRDTRKALREMLGVDALPVKLIELCDKVETVWKRHTLRAISLDVMAVLLVVSGAIDEVDKGDVMDPELAKWKDVPQGTPVFAHWFGGKPGTFIGIGSGACLKINVNGSGMREIRADKVERTDNEE